MIDLTRALLVALEAGLIIAPILYLLWKKRGGADSFHPLVVFPIAFSVFYLLPNIYYLLVSDYHLFSDKALIYRELIWINVALIMFYFGFFVASRIRFKPSFYLEGSIKEKWQPPVFIILGLVSLGSFTWFMYISGGFQYYINHLNDTITLTSGKIYLIWGILLLRTVFLFNFIYCLQAIREGRLGKKVGVAGLVIQFILVLALTLSIGARILALSFLIETIVFIHYALKRINFAYLAVAALLLFAFFVVIMGAWRNYGWISSSESKVPVSGCNTQIEIVSSESAKVSSNNNFASYLFTESTQNLGNRLFNYYFDSVKNFGYSLKYTDHGIPVQWGRTYLALLVQPIPQAYRPGIKLPLGPEMDGVYCGSPRGGEYCGIDPLLGELYQNFKEFGILVGLFLFGLVTRFVYRYLILDKRANYFSYMLYGIYVYAIFFWLRGTFVGHTSFILMDAIPLILLFIFFRRHGNNNRFSLFGSK